MAAVVALIVVLGAIIWLAMSRVSLWVWALAAAALATAAPPPRLRVRP